MCRLRVRDANVRNQRVIIDRQFVPADNASA
jgi:hypothetical protein